MKGTYGYLPENNELEKNYLLYTDALGCISCDPDFLIKRENAGKYLIMSCVSGALHIEDNDRLMKLEPGMSCFMTLKKPHYYYSDRSAPCELLWIDFNGRPVVELEEKILQGKSFLLFPDPEIPELIRACLRHAKDRQFGYKTEISALLYQILMKSFSASQALFHEGAPDSRFVDRFNRYIGENVRKNLTLGEMADYFGWEKSYFCRKCRRETGMSPVRYFKKQKLETAKFLLKCTSKSINEIAKELGFSDQNYFSYAFFREEGKYPTFYRRSG